MGIQQEKKQLRSRFRKILTRMTAEERATASLAIIQRIRSLPLWESVSLVLAFIPLETEVAILPLLDEALEEQKIIAVPRCQPDRDLSFHQIRTGYQTSLCNGPYSLKEPPQDWPSIDPETLPPGSLVLVPALAFTPAGERLGKGKGYYDRFLTRIPPHALTIGVCFDQQLIDHLPSSGQDVPVRLVVTDQRCYR
jgi:5-formyltetrahydrofolate cyclo-ligase